MYYYQNIYQPNFGGGVTGATDFPRNVYHFRIIYQSTGKYVIYSYVYTEGKSKKVGKNVVLCMMKSF